MFVLGFHGCDLSTKMAVLKNGERIKASRNTYDWLGHGIYFWENDPRRAMEWATERKSRKKIESPAVIGAVIDLGYCMNLMGREHINVLMDGNNAAMDISTKYGRSIPKNTPDLPLMDCAIINAVHYSMRKNNDKPYDTVRSAFIEGEPLFDLSKLHSKTHIQICVRNINCIKGYFDPLEKNSDPFGHLAVK